MFYSTKTRPTVIFYTKTEQKRLVKWESDSDSGDKFLGFTDAIPHREDTANRRPLARMKEEKKDKRGHRKP